MRNFTSAEIMKAAIEGPASVGAVDCDHCHGYGSSLKEGADVCTRCGGTGLIKSPDKSPDFINGSRTGGAMVRGHQHFWTARYIDRQWIRGQALCATCQMIAPSRPPTDFRVPAMRRELELARLFHRNDALQATDLAGVCPHCGETAYYNTKKKLAGAECVIYYFRCMACGHQDTEPLD